LGFGAAGFVLMGVAASGALFLAAVPVIALQGFAGPSLTSLMSREIGARDQGQLAGANSSILAIAALLGPTIYTSAFAFAVGGGGHYHVAGAPFLIAAGLMLCGLIACVLLDERSGAFLKKRTKKLLVQGVRAGRSDKADS
jgi:DHA1 family tetracycline resistance protein-like MFS transporter